MSPRILFLGSPEAAVPSLEACRSAGEVVGVVSQPDRPAGRGRRAASPPVAEAARSAGLPLFQPEKPHRPEVLQALAALRPDLLVVVAYGRILRAAYLDLAPHGCLNVHFSLLPRHRGAAPVARAILAGDGVTGVTLMRLDAGMDTGPTVSRVEEPIGPEDTTGTLTERLATRGAELLRRDLPRYLRGELPPVPQPSEGATAAPPLEKDEGAIRWDRPAAEVDRRIRAVTPWPGAFGFLQGCRILVRHARPLPYLTSPGPGRLRVEGKRLLVGAADHPIEILELQREGKRCADAACFLAGLRIDPNACLECSPTAKPTG